MPSSYLYAINNEGRVFGLSTSGNMWREFMYLGLEFKQLSAVPHFMWAIGGDRQVYVHVHGLDIPIRIKEETYENERWLPLEGFSGRLLPTDRYNFSNQDGTVDRSRDKVKLPSMAWQWEGDWQIETTLDGQPLDHDVNIFVFTNVADLFACTEITLSSFFYGKNVIVTIFCCMSKHAYIGHVQRKKRSVSNQRLLVLTVRSLNFINYVDELFNCCATVEFAERTQCCKTRCS